MTTSGSRDFNLDVAEIIEEAYERCGLRSPHRLRRQDGSSVSEPDVCRLGQPRPEPLDRGPRHDDPDARHVDLHAWRDVVDILEMVLRRSGTDYEVERISRGEYLNFPNKTDQGRPSQFYLDRKIQPVITLWQAPENSTDVLVYYYVQRIQDADTLVNTTDAPFRFLPCMVAGLGLLPRHEARARAAADVQGCVRRRVQRAAEEDEDRVALKLQPSSRYMRT
jgi:hypothetical protein